MKKPPELVDKTPKEKIYSHGSLTVYHYQNEQAPQHRVPVVLVPPLGVKPYVYDLMPGHSMVEVLLKHGFQVYSLDFGIPEPGDTLNFERYITRWIPRALRQIRRIGKHKQVTLAGYCLGGLFCVIYTAYTRDKNVKNLITFGTPFDGYALYPFAAKVLIPLNRAVSGPISSVLELFGIFPGILLQLGWRIINPSATVTKYGKLVRNLWNPDFIDFYNTLDHWANDFIDYPAEVVKEIYSSLLVNNDLVKGTLALEGKKIDIRDINCSVLSFAGDQDVIGVPRSAKVLVDTISSFDKAFHIVPGGHLAVVTGAQAPKEAWKIMIEWLVPRS